MCLDITVPECIFSECSWAVFWMLAQHAFRFSSNKREKWGASAISTEISMNGQILSMRKERKTQAFGFNQHVSIRSSLHHCLLSPVYFDLRKSSWRAKSFNLNKVTVKFGPSLTARRASDLWVALSESQWRGAGRKQGSAGALFLQSLVMNSWVEEESSLSQGLQ